MDCKSCTLTDIECYEQCKETCLNGVAPEDCKRAIFEECVECKGLSSINDLYQERKRDK